VNQLARETALRVERLLGEIEAMAGPSTWAKVEELVRAFLELQREGLARVMELVSTATDRAALESMLAEDEVVSSLLLLHGLHPLAAAERIRRALDALGPHLETHGAKVDVVEVDPEGASRLRVSGVGGCMGDAIEHALRRAVEEAAPEVTRLEIEMPGERRAPAGLVQIGLKKPERRV
jgi:hypothetical protein